MRKPALKRQPDPVLTRDYSEAEKLITDLGAGQLDLATAARRIHTLFDLAFDAGATARADWSRERTAQLAEENRRLRERLVGHSLVCDPARERGEEANHG